MLIYETARNFELRPLLSTLEGQNNHLNGSTLLNKHSTKEDYEVNGGVYPQPLAKISVEDF